MINDFLWEIREKYNAGIMISGDFNCRIGNLNNIDEDMMVNLNLSHQRNSEDKNLCSNGVLLYDLMCENGLCCVNGRTLGDSRGAYSFINCNGKSTVHYTWVDWNGLEKIKEFSLIDLDTSDHLAQSVIIEREKKIEN